MKLLRIKAILLSITLASMVLVVFMAAASILSIQEAQLSPGASVWEINQSEDDSLVISHPGAKEIWTELTENTFTVYENITDVQDAKTDSSGNIWWSNRTSSFGQISTPTLVVTTWQVPDEQELWGLALDDQDTLWLTGWAESGSKLFNFKPSSGQLCTYTLPTSTNSRYVVHDEGSLWLGNRAEDRIYRVTISDTEALLTWWEMPSNMDSGPIGLTPDGEGNLWWADEQLEGLGFLESANDELSFYALPIGARPQMLLKEESWIWYTEITTDSEGTIGVINPKAADHITATLATSSTVIAPTCGSPELVSSVQVITRSETLTWTAAVTLTPGYAQNGWWIYEIEGEPYDLVERDSRLFVSEQGSQKLLRIPLPILGTLHLNVTPSITETVHGEDVVYTYAVSYTNRDGSSADQILPTDEGCSPINGPTGDSNMDGILDVGESWAYSCTAAIPDHDDSETVITGTVSTAMVSGVDADGFLLESSTEITEVPLAHDKGVLSVIKSGPDSAAHGVSVTFEYSVTYDSQDEASAKSVSLADDKCSSISAPDGDDDDDGRLDVTELWTYSCQATVPVHSEDEDNPWTSKATVNANTFDGAKVQPATDRHDLSFVHTVGRLILTKIGPHFGRHGQSVTYSFILAFENEDRSAANSVKIIDDKCSPVTLVFGDNNDDTKLNVGEFWLYRCSYVVPPHTSTEENPLTNTAVSSGNNEDDKSVQADSDRHKLVILEADVYLPAISN